MNKLEVLERLTKLEDALFDAELQLKKLDEVKEDFVTLACLVSANNVEKKDIYDAIFQMKATYQRVKNFELCFADNFENETV